jgi:hypothetical protein
MGWICGQTEMNANECIKLFIMKTSKFLILFSIYFIASCSSITQKKEIELVKNAPLEFGFSGKYVIGDLVKEIAGIKGTVKWKSFSPQGYESNPYVSCVQVDITRNMKKNNLVSMQFLVNTETGLVKTGHLEVDGEGKSVMDFYGILMQIGIENIR